MKSPELALELATPVLGELAGPYHHEHLPGLRQQLNNVIDDSRKIVVDGQGDLVVSKRSISEKTAIEGREQERHAGKDLLPMLARKRRRRASDGHDEVRLGTIDENGPDVIDDRLFRDVAETRWTQDNLDNVYGRFGALVQFDAKVAGELIDGQVAAINPLQYQQLAHHRLGVARCSAQEQRDGYYACRHHT